MTMMKYSSRCLLVVAWFQVAPTQIQLKAVQAQQQQDVSCQLCPDGSVMEGGSIPVPPVLLQSVLSNTDVSITTCADIDLALTDIVTASNGTSSSCAGLVQGITMGVDFQYYCQCSGVPSPGICAFCEVPDANADAAISGALAPLTCKDAANFAMSIISEFNCSPDPALASFCCGDATATGDDDLAAATDDVQTSTDAPSTGEDTAGDDAAGDDTTDAGNSQCQICPSGTTMENADRPLPPSLFDVQFSGLTLDVCGDLDGLLARVAGSGNNGDCSNLVETFISRYNYQYYCGCSGVAAASGVCTSCPNTATPDLVLESSALAPLTCADATVFVDSITDQNSCGIQSSYFTTCCVDVIEADSAPTASPTAAPTIDQGGDDLIPIETDDSVLGSDNATETNNQGDDDVTDESAPNSDNATNTDQCQLCPAGSTMAGLNMPVPTEYVGDLGLPISTCADLDALVRFAGARDSQNCAATIASITDEVNFQYYCQCTGVVDPDNCDFCTLTNPTAEVASVDLGFSPLTCRDVAELFDSFNSVDQCVIDPDIEALCCGDEIISSESGAKSLVPTSSLMPTSVDTDPSPAPGLAGDAESASNPETEGDSPSSAPSRESIDPINSSSSKGAPICCVTTTSIVAIGAMIAGFLAV